MLDEKQLEKYGVAKFACVTELVLGLYKE